MKRMITIWTLLLICGMAGNASAAFFSDTLYGNTLNDGTRLAITSTLPTSLQLDLTASGFTTGAYTITSAVLYYTFYDADNPKDSALMQTGAADGNLTIGDYRGSKMLDLGPKKKQTYSQSFSYSLAPADYTWLDDGKLLVTISSDDNIELDQLRLEVQADAQPVPLPNVAWLLGPSLLGMVAIRRKVKGDHTS